MTRKSGWASASATGAMVLTEPQGVNFLSELLWDWRVGGKSGTIKKYMLTAGVSRFITGTEEEQEATVEHVVRLCGVMADCDRIMKLIFTD